ncbi:hypothetical protein SUSAZ_01770 [Sulfolobus acidocaldarius SUSAZ]|nr:hypothetical protein SUSAZ_01770 [Sulfolobus acidocaldarius SUSAZ]
MVHFAVWLDGVILKIDLTNQLYKLYKGENIKSLPITYEVHEDWHKLYEQVKDKLAVLSPYDPVTTNQLLKRINVSPLYVVSNTGRTKPSKEPVEILFKITEWDPLDVVIIGSSPLDLLSARFFDSRIKVVCVNRYYDCSKYSPFIMSNDLLSALGSLKRLKIFI